MDELHMGKGHMLLLQYIERLHHGHTRMPPHYHPSLSISWNHCLNVTSVITFPNLRHELVLENKSHIIVPPLYYYLHRS